MNSTHRFCLLVLLATTVFIMGTEQFTISPKQELNSDKSMVSFVVSKNLKTRNTTKLHNFQHSNSLQLTKSEARGSTYSYYYISRRVWYIPLWFLIYFCLYILGLIIRSIILHKVSSVLPSNSATTDLKVNLGPKQKLLFLEILFSAKKLSFLDPKKLFVGFFTYRGSSRMNNQSLLKNNLILINSKQFRHYDHKLRLLTSSC